VRRDLANGREDLGRDPLPEPLPFRVAGGEGEAVEARFVDDGEGLDAFGGFGADDGFFVVVASTERAAQM